jgi:hypothetical protein
MMVATGVLLVLLRYGWRVPVWARIKFGRSIAIISISILTLLLVTTIVAIWKPFANGIRGRRARGESVEAA